MPLPKHAELFFGLDLTEEQQRYADSIFDKRLTIVDAKSGSGKTTIAVGCAKLIHEQAKKNNPFGKPLLYIFAPVQEKAMGFRPGNQETKEEEYLQPLKDALLEIGENPAQVIFNEEMLKDKKPNLDNVWVYAKSHVFARGTNIKGKTVIIDEAQNFTRGELKKILTRIHDDCTVIMIGHRGQIDLPDPKKSGFVPYMEWFKDKHYVQVLELTKNFRGELAQDADDFNW
jgi:phosphate starvation-inducible protein PhoH and related proteins